MKTSIKQKLLIFLAFVAAIAFYTDYKSLKAAQESFEAGEAFDFGDYTCRLRYGGIVIMGYDGTEDKIIIPDRIRDHAVVSIENRTFFACNAKKITVPESVEYIGDDVFSQCKNLSEIVLPKENVTFGTRVLSDCPALRSITIPAWTKHSRFDLPVAFCEGCTALESVTFTPTSRVIFVQEHAFRDCPNIREVNGLEYINLIDGRTFAGTPFMESMPDTVYIANDTLMCYQGDAEYFEVPAHTRAICDHAFANASVKEVHIPASIEGIGGAFHDQKTIEVISGMESVTYYRYDAFNGCSSLKTIENIENMEDIPKTAFDDSLFLEDHLTNGMIILEDGRLIGHKLEGVKTVEIPEGVTTIGRGAFYNSSFTEVTIPESVTTIEKGAFKNMPNLKVIHGAKGVTKLSKTAFEGSFLLNEGRFVRIGEDIVLGYAGEDAIVRVPEGTRLYQHHGHIGMKTHTIVFPDTIEVLDGTFVLYRQAREAFVNMLGITGYLQMRPNPYRFIDRTPERIHLVSKKAFRMAPTVETDGTIELVTHLVEDTEEIPYYPFSAASEKAIALLDLFEPNITNARSDQLVESICNEEEDDISGFSEYKDYLREDPQVRIRTTIYNDKSTYHFGFKTTLTYQPDGAITRLKDCVISLEHYPDHRLVLDVIRVLCQKYGMYQELENGGLRWQEDGYRIELTRGEYYEAMDIHFFVTTRPEGY